MLHLEVSIRMQRQLDSTTISQGLQWYSVSNWSCWIGLIGYLATSQCLSLSLFPLTFTQTYDITYTKSNKCHYWQLGFKIWRSQWPHSKKRGPVCHLFSVWQGEEVTKTSMLRTSFLNALFILNLSCILEQAESTVGKHSVTSCVWAHFPDRFPY